MAYRWTLEVQEKVTQYVRAGGFAWVAAEAAGVPKATFDDWMRRGAESARQPYRGFRDAVLQARAQSRLKAEMETRAKFPRDWLRMGPGRERPSWPGWSQPPRLDVAHASAGVFDLATCAKVADLVLEVVDTPDVRLKLAEAFGSFARRRCLGDLGWC
jgi:hypothetical protein